jgi:hypothetical protein
MEAVFAAVPAAVEQAAYPYPREALEYVVLLSLNVLCQYVPSYIKITIYPAAQLLKVEVLIAVVPYLIIDLAPVAVPP